MKNVYIVEVNGKLDNIYKKREDAINRLNELAREFKVYDDGDTVVDRVGDDYVFAHDIYGEYWESIITVKEKAVL